MEQSYQRGSKELSKILIQDSVVIGNVGTSEKVSIRSVDELNRIKQRYVEAMYGTSWKEETKLVYLKCCDFLSDEEIERELRFLNGIKTLEEIQRAFS
mgnify:CR=1 FL=1